MSRSASDPGRRPPCPCRRRRSRAARSRRSRHGHFAGLRAPFRGRPLRQRLLARRARACPFSLVWAVWSARSHGREGRPCPTAPSLLAGLFFTARSVLLAPGDRQHLDRQRHLLRLSRAGLGGAALADHARRAGRANDARRPRRLPRRRGAPDLPFRRPRRFAPDRRPLRHRDLLLLRPLLPRRAPRARDARGRRDDALVDRRHARRPLRRRASSPARPSSPETLAGAANLLALGIVSHAGGQGLLAIALGVLSASFSSLVIFIEAVAAALFAWAFAGESIDVMQIAGGLLVLAGVYVADRGPSDPKPLRSPPTPRRRPRREGCRLGPSTGTDREPSTRRRAPGPFLGARQLPTILAS